MRQVAVVNLLLVMILTVAGTGQVAAGLFETHDIAEEAYIYACSRIANYKAR
jgi:hypothetical protein